MIIVLSVLKDPNNDKYIAVGFIQIFFLWRPPQITRQSLFHPCSSPFLTMQTILVKSLSNCHWLRPDYHPDENAGLHKRITRDELVWEYPPGGYLVVCRRYTSWRYLHVFNPLATIIFAKPRFRLL